MNFKTLKNKLLNNNPFINLKYNMLAMFSALLAFVNTVLNLKVFGISLEADAFYIANTIFTTLSLIPLLFIEQFFYYYNEYKLNSKSEAESFLFSITIIISLFQILLTTAFLLGMDVVLKLFAHGLDDARYQLLKALSIIFFISLLFMPAKAIFNAAITAEKRFVAIYIFQLITPFLSTIAYAYLWIVGKKDIVLIAYAVLASEIFIFIGQFLLLKIIGIKIRVSFDLQKLSKFFVNNVKMNIGFRIKDYIVPPLISNILSTMPFGYPSAYSYAYKFVMILQSVVIAPPTKILSVELSSLWIQRKIKEYVSALKKYFFSLYALLIPIICATFFLIPYFLNLISQKEIDQDKIFQIQFLFSLLSIWLILDSTENSLSQYFIISKMSLFFYIKNILFSICFAIVSILVGLYDKSVSIPVAMIIAQSSAIFLILIIKKNAVLKYIK
jgi:hypothetical protein